MYLRETLTKRVCHCLLCLISLSMATDRYLILSVSLTNVCSFFFRCVSHRLFLIKNQCKRNLFSSFIPDLFSFFVGVHVDCTLFLSLFEQNSTFRINTMFDLNETDQTKRDMTVHLEEILFERVLEIADCFVEDHQACSLDMMKLTKHLRLQKNNNEHFDSKAIRSSCARLGFSTGSDIFC